MGTEKTYKEIADAVLMQHYIDGDSGALGEIYDRYHRRMLGYFYRMLWQDHEKSEDFMQELFLKLAHRPEAYDTTRNFKTWLFSVAHNMCKNEYKKQEIRTRVHEEILYDGSTDTSLAGGRDHDMEKFNKALEKELGSLGEPHRSTFHFRFREELQVKEIAEIMNVSEGTVKSRIFYTLKKLSAKLRAFDPKLQPYGTR